MRRAPFLIALALLAAAPLPLHAQATINLRNADIRAFIDDVSRVTGSSFVIDPRVQGTVSVVSDKPLGRTQYFELFLATLRANGFVAVPTGAGQFRIQPAEAGAGAVGGRYATAVVPLSNIDAQQAVESLRPVLSRNGTASANKAGNAVIITDFADNISRARSVLQQVDRDRSSTQVIQLRHAGARELAQSLQRLVQQPGGDNTVAVSIVPIDASNSVAIRGEAQRVAAMGKMIRDLDQKAAGGSVSRVIFLQNADAGSVLPVLQQLMGQAPTPVNNNSGMQGLAGTPFGQRNNGQQQQQMPMPEQVAQSAQNLGAAAGDTRRRAVIARYEGANALIIAASPEIQRELGEVIRQLDTRRAQVHVEAIIVELSDNVSKQLGVQFLLGGKDGTVPLFSSNFTNSGVNILSLAGAYAGQKGIISKEAGDAFSQSLVGSILGANPVLGGMAGAANVSGNNFFGLLINAAKTDANSNVLSTPSIMTLDNQPARILVGQEIPVTTGEALSENLDNSFRTVQRQDVGIQLSVKPQINAGGTITLTLKQVVSSVAATVADRDFVLNKRELETAVTVGDGQIVALGGLLDDNERRSLQKIPGLGDIPVLGELFKSRSRSHVKTNLMIFIRPTIVRTPEDADNITASRWNTVREAQTQRDGQSSLDAMAWEYLRTAPPFQPAAFPPPGQMPQPAPTQKKPRR